MSGEMKIKAFAEKVGRPYAAVLKAVHDAGIETPRNRNEPRLLSLAEQKMLEAKIKKA